MLHVTQAAVLRGVMEPGIPHPPTLAWGREPQGDQQYSCASPRALGGKDRPPKHVCLLSEWTGQGHWGTEETLQANHLLLPLRLRLNLSHFVRTCVSVERALPSLGKLEGS